MSTSNPKSSARDILPRVSDQEFPANLQARREGEGSTIATDRRSSRDLSSSRTKETINWQSEPNTGAQVLLEPVSPHPYDLSYAFLLIPRFSTHHLIGDISGYLRDWMQQICLSFAWRLDFLTIRPEYLQWILSVPPAMPPSHCIRIIRQQTSRLIFEDFPLIRQENLSKDFWAPGYLLLVGIRPHPPEMIDEYIQLTRQQQGIPPRRSE